MNAYDELINYLNKDEQVEAIVFGFWGHDTTDTPSDYSSAPQPPPVPFEKRGEILTLDAAKPLMLGWAFKNTHHLFHGYSAYIWTNHRIIWVSTYDGCTWLSSAPRNPQRGTPKFSGC